MSKAAEANATATNARPLEHGYAFESFWKSQHNGEAPPQPRVAAASAEKARPGYTDISATEFLDTPEVLSAKIDFLISMWKNAETPVVYGGAGVSACIPDYASKAKDSVTAKPSDSGNRLHRPPTYAHHVLAALERKGMVAMLLDQNHDGLALKAGFPYQKADFIHGAWSTPWNRVKMMDDKVNNYMHQWMLLAIRDADFCFAVGTSLSGMGADACAQETALRHKDGGKGQGTAILTLQRTQMDHLAAVKIYGLIEPVFQELEKRLSLRVGSTTHQIPMMREPPRGAVPPPLSKTPFGSSSSSSKTTSPAKK